jgi:hypothetical protein
MRIFGHHKQSSRPLNEHQQALKTTQIVVNKMIRERDFGLPCITCGGFHQLFAGHFRTSTNTTTRFHPYNLAGQCNSCNSFNGGMTYEYGLAIDRKYGKGWAAFLEKLARAKENWTTKELEQLRSAARMGPRAYQQLYFELRPHHQRSS